MRCPRPRLRHGDSSRAVSLRLFADELIRFTGSPVRDCLDAIPYLFRVTGDRAVPVVIDEFPFLVKASPALPSIIQRELGRGGAGPRAGPGCSCAAPPCRSWAACCPDGHRCACGQVLSCSSTPSATGMPHDSGRSPTPGWPCSCTPSWEALRPTAGNSCGKTPRPRWPTSTHG